MLAIFEAPGEYRAGQALRRCGRCGEMKPVSAFYFKDRRRGVLKSYCVPCANAYSHEHYQRNRATYVARADAWRRRERPRIRELIDEYLRSHPCVDCSESRITLLEFDHRDRAEKALSVARLARNTTWTKVEHEIKKCDVRCANCHRRRTASQFGWAKLGGVHLDGEPRPGATGRYAKIDAPRQQRLFDSSEDGLRQCSRCHEPRPLADFRLRDVRAGKPGFYCSRCRRAYRRAHYERNRTDYIGRAAIGARRRREDVLLLLHAYLLDHPCVDCGETDIIVLEFDHMDPSKKTIAIGQMIGRRSWSTIRKEIEKCSVRCANCHRRRTATQQGWKVRLTESPQLYRWRTGPDTMDKLRVWRSGNAGPSHGSVAGSIPATRSASVRSRRISLASPRPLRPYR